MADPKATVFIATSLDGFIARPDGAIDWLDHADDGPGEDYGFAAFMKTVDVLVMGRNTFEVVRGFGKWPYGTKPVVVLTSRKLAIPKELAKTVSTMSGRVDAILSTLATREMKHIYVDGGVTIQRFLNSGAIQRMIITRIPVLIGTGIPLFGKLENGDITLKHVETRTYGSGLVTSEYEIRAKRRPSRKTRASKAKK